MTRSTQRTSWDRSRGRTRRLPLVLSVAIGLSIGACGTSPPAVKPPSVFVGTQVDRPTPDSVLRLPLTTSDGRSVTLSSFEDDLVVCDVMTLDRKTSPANTTAVVQAPRAVEAAGLGDRVRFLSITIDPQRDTSTRLAAYGLLYFAAPSDWALLTGSPATIDALWDHFSVCRERVPDVSDQAVDWMTLHPLTYIVAHNDEVHFLDRAHDDRFVLGGPGDFLRTDSIPPRWTCFWTDNCAVT